MKITYKQTIFCFILLLLAISSSYFYWILMAKEPPPHHQKRHVVDAFMQNALIMRFTTEGQLRDHLAVDVIRHYQDNDSSYFIKPLLTVFDYPRQPWHLSSDYGTALANFQQINLWQNVLLHQDRGLHNQDNNLKTSKLTISPNKNIATTDQEVTLWQDDNFTTKAQGMIADLQNNQLNLLQHVVTDYKTVANTKG